MRDVKRTTDAKNPLIDDREIEFLLYDVLRAEELLALPAFAEHSRETFDMVLGSCRRLAREVLFPTYRELDAAPPVLAEGRVTLHPKMKELYPKLLALGLITAPRPHGVGGQQLPLVIDTVAQAYLCAGNVGAAGWIIMCRGTGHLLEAFGSEALKREYMDPLYRGQWTGTMALTEPHAGSSLGDLRTVARPTSAGHYLVRGSKIFITGADQDLTENIVHLVLARIEGAPEGTKGISLFAIPKMRREGDALVSNDVAIAGLIHKIGWRALPSVALELGENDDCHGWLVGEPHQGLSYMFQMMNEARITVGVAGAATASVAYHEALGYALTRPQGRALGARGGEQVAIVEHPDVRRMLLRQKAIVEGAISLVVTTARYADLAEHHPDAAERTKARTLLDVLTPIAKTFPAEKGFEANALALQVHGGYGYSSEYLPEAWMRDQKLNSIHEGTSGIQGLDLLGRKVMARGGEALRLLAGEVTSAIDEARAAGVAAALCDALASATATVGETTMQLGAMGMSGDAARMMLHSSDYLDMASTWVVGWQWLRHATAAQRIVASGGPRAAYAEGKLCAAQYFLETELGRIPHLARLCTSAEDSYARMNVEWF
ncbi:MAG: acyl-CoA dehydrogenase [Labilithrix sp.]|nr:acyl-CoA dehydrogenase [Labilithrix sp.]